MEGIGRGIKKEIQRGGLGKKSKIMRVFFERWKI